MLYCIIHPITCTFFSSLAQNSCSSFSIVLYTQSHAHFFPRLHRIPAVHLIHYIYRSFHSNSLPLKAILPNNLYIQHGMFLYVSLNVCRCFLSCVAAFSIVTAKSRPTQNNPARRKRKRHRLFGGNNPVIVNVEARRIEMALAALPPKITVPVARPKTKSIPKHVSSVLSSTLTQYLKFQCTSQV